MADDNQNGTVVDLRNAAATRRRRDAAPQAEVAAPSAVPPNCGSARDHLLAQIQAAQPPGPFSGRGG